MSTPAQAKLIRMFSVEPYGGDAVVVHDIDGDGRLEMLILQSAGQFASDLSIGRPDVDDVDRHLFCLTAVTLEGQMLWQFGEPYSRDFPFTSHGVQGGKQMAVADIDNDGAIEIIVIRRSELLVIDARTGQLKRSTQLPLDNFLVVATAQMGPKEQGRQILCKVNDQTYKPWRYANPTMILNADLSVRREPFAVRGAGHNFVVMDVDGDGREEVFVGYVLLDDQGERWALDLGEGFDYVADHADQIAVSDLDEDGRLEVRYAGSEDFFVCTTEGEILWKVKAGHSQQSAEGRWAADGSHHIIMAEKNAGLTGITPRGEVRWQRKDLNGYVTASVRWPDQDGKLREWALFRPQLRPIQPAPYTSDPAWSRGLWPHLLDGEGRTYQFLPWSRDYAQPAQHIRAERSYDCGVKYYPIVADLTGTGQHNVIVHDRRRVWIFGA